jgi:ABC-2 type transport system ATP-binding protein
VPQEFNINIFEKVIDIVMTRPAFMASRAPEALKTPSRSSKTLGLWEKRNEPSQKLSGGMKRRLMIARALIHKPQTPHTRRADRRCRRELRRSMWTFLRKMNAEGVTIILTTHYLEEAEQLCRTVAFINKGEIV